MADDQHPHPGALAADDEIKRDTEIGRQLAEQPYCHCATPDPHTDDEPWVPVVCGNCGGQL